MFCLQPTAVDEPVWLDPPGVSKLGNVCSKTTTFFVPICHQGRRGSADEQPLCLLVRAYTYRMAKHFDIKTAVSMRGDHLRRVREHEECVSPAYGV